MIELDDLRDALEQPDRSEDPYIRDLEAAAVAYAERQTGLYLGAARDATEYVIGGGTSDLWLAGPVAEITSVTEHAYSGDDGTVLTAEDDDGYLVRGDRLVRKNGNTWYRGYEYEVAYSQGADVPADIQQAVRQLVALWFEARLPVSDAGLQDIPHTVSDIFAAHRAPRI